ncbi:hypothetical protein E8E13_009218 [Curvularia kusanoi]|uniref:Ubiquitin-like domain-containing protein n=1 Tax=Curvularia kusanoi TaxID=90978 RepID=A0A9P4TJ48_CURKU|nr:hypothetical protein E8E13_009218 [Curvularia kusanoi]
MTDANTGAPAPKKRSLFKRAAWQDAAKKETEDMFSHSNEFKDIVAEENRRKEEEKRKQAEAKRKAEEEEKRTQIQKQDKKGKRRKVSAEFDEPILLHSDSGDSSRISRSQAKARSRTPFSPTESGLPSNSLAAQYETVAKSSQAQNSRAEPVIVDLGDSDGDDGDNVYNSKASADHIELEDDANYDVALRPSNSTVLDDNGYEEVVDPEIAAIEARARARAAAKIAAAASGRKAPIAQLLIASQLPDTSPLMVKVRIDTTIEKPREAWCARQGFSTEKTRNVFFTWRGTRLYDSTTIRRLGIKVDGHGNVSLEGDDSIYDETNTPKIHVEAWTEELFAQHKREQAAAAEARQRAAEASPVVEEREPTPEPEPEEKKYRLYLKAKGLDDFRIQVRPETTFERLANAFRTAHNIPETQPITLMFDGDRLLPMDAIQDSELEDMDSIDVLLK